MDAEIEIMIMLTLCLTSCSALGTTSRLSSCSVKIFCIKSPPENASPPDGGPKINN